ncbi:MAG: cation diffusion facilitator family transporter [Aeromicrobium sp.]|uniref:cation diffusion facilitator family transporter n=1 Tax=Aeromicrobium sp. TaxID=1871063 RepID=UPI0039E2BF99
MGHGHDHGHAGAGVAHRGRLVLVLAMSVAVLLVQAVVAMLTGSLALLADAGHMLSDVIGIVLALAAITVAQLGGRPGSRRTFGYQRTEVLAAGANGLVLLGVAAWVVWSAVRRLGDAPHIDAAPVLVAGAVGLTVNVIGLFLLRAGAEESLNVRGAYLELMGDALGSVAVLVSAGVVWATGWHAADPVASLLIAVFIVPRAASLLREVGEVLMESTPRDLDLDELRRHLLAMDGVADVHDLHVWTITSGMPVMSAHIVVEASITGLDESQAVLDRMRACLAEHFDVEHSTFQIESPGHTEPVGHLHH